MRSDDDPRDPTSPTDATADDLSLALIEEQADHAIRRLWRDGRWYFSVIDVIGVLTDAPIPRNYWADMKRRIQNEGFYELLAKCQRLKLTATDGKNRVTDAADTETLLRIIQSVPSPKAEPIKQWLAREGAKRLEEATRPLDAEQARAERETFTKPEWDAPALAWAEYFEQMATLYRRQYAYDQRLAATERSLDDHAQRLDDHSERLEEQDEWLNEHAQRLEDHDTRADAIRRDIEDLRAGQRQLPELLARLGPQTLTPAHQARVKALAVQLHDLGGFAFPTIYGDLNAHFHVGKYSDIADAQWDAVADWFQIRLDAAEKRRQRPQ